MAEPRADAHPLGVGLPVFSTERHKPMKTSLWSIGVALLVAMPLASAESGSDRTDRPCFHVGIQNDRSNDSTVQQNCERNFNRTVQAGAQNRAHTTQTGQVNNNKVRQYQYDVPPGFDRSRGGN